jgi:hypothetical protein
MHPVKRRTTSCLVVAGCACAAVSSSCRQAGGPYVAEWPGGSSVATTDSVATLFRTYFGRAPSALVGCGARRVGVAMADAPGGLRNLTRRSGDTTYTPDPRVGRVQGSIAEAVAVLAWAALEGSGVVDTISVQLATPHSRVQYHFVPAEGSYLHPLRMVDREVAWCGRLT